MYMMLILNIMFSFLFSFLKHPLSMGCILLIQTIIISLMTGSLYYNFWFSYILFLIMIGGMLVMFIYMTSIASNEKFMIPKFFPLFLLIIILCTFMLFYSDKFWTELTSTKMIMLSQSKLMLNFNMNKFFNYPNFKMMLILIIYLLITLIATVKIVGKNLSTLRQI
uniref:NADH-ubiquinone oxidoreductase chain 6 n=1 Tax=Curculionidae sp. 2 AH-2016 TaxID=1903828 RepID=A0A343C2P0_9CUCU|nr:NADH dehydrogenase subunit 6 [Curculionidae sp. 2 AH-2016]